MENRVFKRGSSKTRTQSNSRQEQQQQQQQQEQQDSMQSTLQKSLIANIVKGARASLQEPSRPFTPGDLPRHLINGDDYSNRPISSYKMKNVVGQAINDFNNDINQSQSTTATMGSSQVNQKIGVQKKFQISSGGGVSNKDQSTNILTVLQHAENVTKKGNKLPALEPIQQKGSQLPALVGGGGGFKQINKSSIKGFESGKPIKVITEKQTSSSSTIAENDNNNIAQQQQPIPAPKQQYKVKKVEGKNNKNNSGSVVQHQIASQKSMEDDFSEFMNEELKIQESLKFEQNRIDNLKKHQSLQQEIKKTNRKKQQEYEGEEDEDGLGGYDNCDEVEDEYEEYFTNQLMKDMEYVEENGGLNSQIDYDQVLNNIQSKIKDINQDKQAIEREEGEEEEEYLMQNIEELKQCSTYELEYREVISEIGKYCSIITFNQKQESKDKKIPINEEEVLGICTRIWSLATNYKQQSQQIKDKCFLETLLKGSFAMLGVKMAKPVLRLSACNIFLFLKILENELDGGVVGQSDFKKAYSYLFDTIKGVLLYAKEGKHDLLFKEEQLSQALGSVIKTCFLEKSQKIMKLTSQVVNKKEIGNEDLIYDLTNYTIGCIKCFTQTNQEVQQECINQKYIQLLAKTIDKALTFGKDSNKKSMILVQITGTIRNLSNDDKSYQQIAQNQIIHKLLSFVSQFKGHKELVLNTVRILSKLSNDPQCAAQMAKKEHLKSMMDIMEEYAEVPTILIRVGFVLGNLTTTYEDVRIELNEELKALERIIKLTLLYLDKDEKTEQKTKKQEKQGGNGKEVQQIGGNVEDSITKLIRLIANLCTDEDLCSKKLLQIQPQLEQLINKLLNSIQKRVKIVGESEEFILNSISCITNILFYDIPQQQLFNDSQRVQIFKLLKTFVLYTQNEEIQIESVRVLSNISRHAALCEEFVSDKEFLETLMIALENTLRDLVFYTVGIVINITLHQRTRVKVTDKGCISKLIEVLKDANIEDLDLSKVAAKAIHNMTSESNYWTVDIIKKLDELLTSLGDELDSIMEVANEDEQRELMGLRELINALINDMPQPMYDCPINACGRKFKNNEELELHLSRRHGGGGIAIDKK